MKDFEYRMRGNETTTPKKMRGMSLTISDMTDEVAQRFFYREAGDPQQPTLRLLHGSSAWAGNSLQDAANSLLGWINSLFGAN